MANGKDNNDLFFIAGGIIALIAGVLGVGYLTNKGNDLPSRQEIHGEKPKSTCNKCPFS